MTDTQVHPDGGSRAEGPLLGHKHTLDCPRKCGLGERDTDILMERDRLRQENAELREALERVAVVAEHYMPNDDYDGPGEVHAALHEAWDAIHEARAAIARSQP